MVQKTKIHLLGSDTPIERVADSIDAIEIPTPGWYGDINFSSIELDVHVTCADDINKLMYKLAKLQELFEPIAEENSNEGFTVGDFSAEELEVLNNLFPLPEGAFRPTFAHVGLPFVKAVKEIARLRNILKINIETSK